ncbi:ribosomal protein YmL20 [Histoplasma ohiense]|nr:ribosomal protein YmL20 [Histoplasma ohiense (nom. inval.)]
MACPVTYSRRNILILPFLLPSWSESAASTVVCRRYQSTFRRLKQRLRVKPDASFSPLSANSPERIIYNPPSSAPSVYHTPTKFLPPDDVRRKLRASSFPGDPQQQQQKHSQLPPVFRQKSQAKTILGEQEIAEMRQLRLEDPMKWSRYALAQKFGCSTHFVMQVCDAGPQKKAIQQQVLEAIKSRWGKKRTIAREDRQLRKELWATDQ